MKEIAMKSIGYRFLCSFSKILVMTGILMVMGIFLGCKKGNPQLAYELYLSGLEAYSKKDFSTAEELYNHIVSFVNDPDSYYYIQKLETSILNSSMDHINGLDFYEFDVMKRINNKEMTLYDNLYLVTSDEGAALIVSVQKQSFVLASGIFSELDWKQEFS